MTAPDLTCRQQWLLDLLREHPTVLHVVAHRTTPQAAAIAETGDGVSYTATLRPLLIAGLIHLGYLASVPGRAPRQLQRYRWRGRPITLTPAGRALTDHDNEETS